jgi:hypothetical protein
MKKITLLSILVLILITSLVKNSTKKIEDEIFSKKENIKSLKVELGNVTLEYNYLSSPEKLIQYQSQYFEDDLLKIDIMKIKQITLENGSLLLNDLVKEINDE